MTGILAKIKATTSEQIHKLARSSDPRLETIKHTHNVFVNNESPNAPHGHPDGSHIHDFWIQGNSPTKGRGFRNKVSTQLTWPEDYNEDEHYLHLHNWDSIVWEKEHPLEAHSFVNPIKDIRVKSLSPENQKLKKIENDNYEKVDSFNNELGSPWTEMYDLEMKIQDLEVYADDYPNIQWMGEKQALLHLMQVVLHYTIDAKWALTHYQDYIQRGYDYQFNEGVQSIRWSDFENEPNPPMDHSPGAPEDFREGRTDGNKLEEQPTIGAKVNVNALANLFGSNDPFGGIIKDLKAKLPTKLPF